jgi:mRNA interferase MazF
MGRFVSGGLHRAGNARPNRLFTADSAMFLYRAGTLSAAKIDQVTDAIIKILQG